MRFFATLRLPGRNGSQAQTIIFDHDDESVEDFNETLNSEDFILVTEVHTDRRNGQHVTGRLVSLNHDVFGKVAEFNPNREF